MKMKALFVYLGCIAFASAAFAQAGSGTLSGPESLKIQRCAKGRANPSLAVAVNANGAFTIGAYAGTSTTTGSVTQLSFDQGSNQRVVALMAGLAVLPAASRQEKSLARSV